MNKLCSIALLLLLPSSAYADIQTFADRYGANSTITQLPLYWHPERNTCMKDSDEAQKLDTQVIEQEIDVEQHVDAYNSRIKNPKEAQKYREQEIKKRQQHKKEIEKKQQKMAEQRRKDQEKARKEREKLAAQRQKEKEKAERAQAKARKQNSGSAHKAAKPAKQAKPAKAPRKEKAEKVRAEKQPKPAKKPRKEKQPKAIKEPRAAKALAAQPAGPDMKRVEEISATTQREADAIKAEKRKIQRILNRS